MYAIELPVEGTPHFRTLAAPNVPAPGLRFTLAVGILSGPTEAPWSSFPTGREQVLYAAQGKGRARLPSGEILLEKFQAYRSGTPLFTPPVFRPEDTPLVVVALSSQEEPPEESEDEVDLSEMEGMRFPARRWGRSIVNGASPIKCSGFTAGLSILEPAGGQVPWHGHPDQQSELYLILEGRAQVCVGEEVRELQGPGAVFIPGDKWHQITNVDPEKSLPLIYCYEGSVPAPHWWQEQQGVLPEAGKEGNPPLPAGAFPQCTSRSEEEWKEIAAQYL